MRKAALLLLLVGVGACGMRRYPTALSQANRRFPRSPASFGQVHRGMDQGEVQVLLGPPDALDYGITPWGWLVITPDAWRFVYHYRQYGRVMFSCSLYNVAGAVSRVEPDPSDAAQ